MNFNKILATCAICTSLVFTASSETTSSGSQSGTTGSFYSGLNAGGSFNKYKYKNSPTGTNIKKSATGGLVEAFIGVDNKINELMVGVDLNIGWDFSGKGFVKVSDLPQAEQTPIINNNSTLTTTSQIASVNNKFTVSLMPTIGYCIIPECALYLTGGIGFNSYKLSNLVTKTSKSKTKFVPAIGCGVKYELTPSAFVTLAFVHFFKATITGNSTTATNPITDTTTEGNAHITSNVLKLGVGFRF